MNPATKANAHETNIRRWTTFTPPQSTAHAALRGLVLHRRSHSGKNLHRPQLEQLMNYVRERDTVICHAMDRLARNLDDLRKIVLQRPLPR